MSTPNPTIYVRLAQGAQKLHLHNTQSGQQRLGKVYVAPGGAINVAFIDHVSANGSIDYGKLWLGVAATDPNPFDPAQMQSLTVNGTPLLVFYVNTTEGSYTPGNGQAQEWPAPNPAPISPSATQGAEYKFWIGGTWNNDTFVGDIDPTVVVNPS